MYILGDLPGCPVIKTALPVWGDVGLIPGQGTKIPHAMRHSQKKNLYFLNVELLKIKFKIY